MQMKGVSEKTKQKQFRAERNAEIKSDKCVSQFTMTIRFLFFFFVDRFFSRVRLYGTERGKKASSSIGSRSHYTLRIDGTKRKK